MFSSSDYERCYNEALKYTHKIDFQKNSSVAYQTSRRRGWLKDYTWFEIKQNPYNNNMDNVYGYFFQKQHSVYIGRSVQPKNRDLQHHKDGSVFEYAKENNIDIPQMTILESNLTLEDGLIYEDLYVKQYRNDGWNVLNKGKTGLTCGSIGSLNKKWTYEKCFIIAKKYTIQKEFWKNDYAAFQAAQKNGWLSTFDWLEKEKNNGYWNYERCYDEALKYTSKKEFRINSCSAYSAAYKHNWLDDYAWLQARAKKHNWTYDECLEIAKQYRSRWDFGKHNHNAYNKSVKMKWIDDFFPKTK